jgi:di/tricarboxylate transporter
VIPPDSGLIGKSFQETFLHDRHGFRVLGIKHKGELVDPRESGRMGAFAEHRLAAGDILLVGGAWERIVELRSASSDVVVLTLPEEYADAVPEYQRTAIALTVLGGMVLLSALEILPLVVAALMAALMMVFSRCLTMDEAYQSMSWSSLILIAGMLPVADALEKTGGIDLIVDSLLSGIGTTHPYVMMSALFFLCALLGLFLSNTAVAVLMAPVAIQAAENLTVSPHVMAMTVAISASAAFVTPVSTPVVTLVVEPGQYTFGDFVKVGLPMLLATWLVALLVIPVMYPF